jgi:hypothetical protein
MYINIYTYVCIYVYEKQDTPYLLIHEYELYVYPHAKQAHQNEPINNDFQ